MRDNLRAGHGGVVGHRDDLVRGAVILRDDCQSLPLMMPRGVGGDTLRT